MEVRDAATAHQLEVANLRGDAARATAEKTHAETLAASLNERVKVGCVRAASLPLTLVLVAAAPGESFLCVQ